MIPQNIKDLQQESVAFDTMERFGLVHKQVAHGSQHYALSSMATVSVTRVSKPVLAKSPPFTAFEGRSELMKTGWETTDSAYRCSVQGKVMMRHQCAKYYNLLLSKFDQVQQMTEQRCFSHAQKHYYYTVIELICNADSFATRLDPSSGFCLT